MKKLFFILTCIISIITANANTLDFKISNVYFKILPKGLGENKGIYHAPSSNEKIIFSYDLQNKSIILEPQYEMDDVQVIITKMVKLLQKSLLIFLKKNNLNVICLIARVANIMFIYWSQEKCNYVKMCVFIFKSIIYEKKCK